MVPAQSPFGTRRARGAAGPLGLWCLFAVLLALVLTHGLSAESGVGHLSSPVAGGDVRPAAAEPPAAQAQRTAVSDRHQGHHEQPDSHPTGACLSGQPPQGAAVHAPDQAPLDHCTPAPTTLLHKVFGASYGRARPPSDGPVLVSAVLRM
ncbi:hypothetical protein ABTY53_14550 [Streptomyces noursei]|uniref:hypothetical protein n=1 Tax=Streptomyces noursei TaxID=1971 RepID=UPI003329907A